MLSIIVAMDKNNLIGSNNSLPWHLPADLAYFRKITTGNTIIMGRKTFDSIGKTLPNRNNVVITRDKSWNADNCQIFFDLDTALKNNPNAIIIGGSNIYQQTLDKADRLYITKVDGEFTGDAYFPNIDYAKWTETKNTSNQADGSNKFKYNFLILDRI